MSVLIVVPARYASSRYPGKPLVTLRGPDGDKTLIRRSWEAAMRAGGGHRVVVATDDDRIATHARAFGAEVVMTSDTCRNGTERCAEVAAKIPEATLIVNLQGDAPLTPPAFVDALIAAIHDAPWAAMATPVLRCDGQALAGFRADRAAGRVGGTTAVFSPTNQAIYFSKEVIPFVSGNFAPEDPTPVFHHVGVYAYRRDALVDYARCPEGPLERLEGLEQLRFLEQGKPVLCVEVTAKHRAFWELNNLSDVALIEGILAQQPTLPDQ